MSVWFLGLGSPRLSPLVGHFNALLDIVQNVPVVSDSEWIESWFLSGVLGLTGDSLLLRVAICSLLVTSSTALVDSGWDNLLHRD